MYDGKNMQSNKKYLILFIKYSKQSKARIKWDHLVEFKTLSIETKPLTAKEGSNKNECGKVIKNFSLNKRKLFHCSAAELWQFLSLLNALYYNEINDFALSNSGHNHKNEQYISLIKLLADYNSLERFW